MDFVYIFYAETQTSLLNYLRILNILKDLLVEIVVEDVHKLMYITLYYAIRCVLFMNDF